MPFFPARSPGAALRSCLCTLGLLALAACSGAAPGTGPAPRSDVLRRSEFADNGRDLYQTLAVLRPQWLNWAVDSVGQVDPRRVAVFVGNEHVGDLTTLQGMSTAEVGTVRLYGAAYVVRTAPALSGSGINAGLYITRTVDPAEVAARKPARAGVSLHGGVLVAGSPASQAFNGLTDAGYTFREHIRYRDSERGTAVVTGQLGGWLALRGPLRLEANVQRASRAEVGAAGNNRSMIGRVASTDADAMLSVPLPSRGLNLRAALGPSVRVVDASWSGSVSPIELPADWTDNRTTGFGAAAALTSSVRLERRFSVEVQAKGRYYLGQDVGEWRDRLTGVQMKGPSFGVSIGLGYEM